MSIVIHGSTLSPFTRKVTLVALEKNIPFQSQDLNPYSPPSNFETMSPLRQIPVLQDGDYTLNDSSAISAYLDAAYSGVHKALLPEAPKARGYVLWIEEYADTALFQCISEGVFRPIFITQFFGKPIDMATVQDTIANRLPVPLGYLETQIIGKNFFAEERLTLADIAVYAQLANLEHAQHLPETSVYPNLMAHFGRMKSRGPIAKLFTLEAQYLNGMLTQLKKSV
ncbi:MAG: glutathione S-transferase family protein [Kofleriaceae bacterium]|nr:glutathione S-transferase family protein [Kofleriaceae bacterium]